MNYKEDKEIADLIKSIRDINAQIINPDSKIRQVVADAQKAYGIEESYKYELAGAVLTHSKITTLDKIDVNILYGKLPEYRKLCQTKLQNRVGQELYEEIKKKENI